MKITNLILSNDIPASQRIMLLTAIAWLPVAVLTFIEGTFTSTTITMPFIADAVPMVKGLVVLPLLVIADNIIEPMMARVLSYLKTSGIVELSDQDKLTGYIEKMTFMFNQKWIQLILLIMAIVVSWFLQRDYVDIWSERGVTSWVIHLEDGAVEKTMAGLWFTFISSPLISFLVYRWVWRFIIWSTFLFRVSRLKLQLLASHTDHAAGLGLIGQGHILFGIIFIVLSCVLSADFANNIFYEGDVLAGLKITIIVFVILCVAVIIGPLSFFSKKLLMLKQKALVEYGSLQMQISRDFHKKWIDDNGRDLMDSIHPSSMADYSVVYDNVSSMRFIPLNLRSILILAGAIMMPFLPLTLTEKSLTDILQIIGSSLF
jgi:hypothetical protein